MTPSGRSAAPRILVDLSVAPHGGAATYARGFARGLVGADLADKDRIVVVVDERWTGAHAEELAWLDEAGVVVDPVAFAPPGTWSARLGRGRRLRAVLARHQVDVAYFPREVAPRVSVPFVVLANNLFAWRRAESAGPVGGQVAAGLLRAAARSTARRASAVLSVSAYLASSFPTAVVPAAIVHHGCLLPERPRSGDGAGEAVRVAMVGTVMANKGMDVVVEGVAIAADRGGRWDLRIHGGVGEPDYAERVDGLARDRLGAAVLAGPVPPAELADAYAAADVLVIGSTFESFCYPLVEGMRSGCVVVAPEGPLVRELCGDVAVTYREGDPASLAAALERAGQERVDRSARGVQRSRTFTWEAAVEAAVSVVRAQAPGASR